MRRLPSTSTKRVLWFRLPSTLFNLKALRPRSLRRSISPVRKYQRAGSALKWVAYSASTGGVSWAGSTVKLTSFNSGVPAGEFWMPCIWWPLLGQGAGGVDEVGHPDVAIERVAVEGPIGFEGELELRHLAERGQGLHRYAGGEREDQAGGEQAESHAALRVDFCAANMPLARSRAMPKAAVTMRLTAAPG